MEEETDLLLSEIAESYINLGAEEDDDNGDSDNKDAKEDKKNKGTSSSDSKKDEMTK